MTIADVALDWDGPVYWRAGERIWGIPYALAALLDETFEHIDDLADASRFAVEVTEAIPVGADLEAIDVDELRSQAWDGTVGAYNAAAVIAALAAAPIPATTEAS
jgi:hypothetical protein